MFNVYVAHGNPSLNRILQGIVQGIPATECKCYQTLPSVADLNNPPAILFAFINFSVQAQVEELTAWLESLGRLKSCRIIVIADGLTGDSQCIERQRKLMSLSVYEIIERPFNLRRIRYLIESTAFQRRSTSQVKKPVSSFEEQIARVAHLDINVLLSGETGVGKTWWAERIHRLSDRSSHPFVVVNCANLSPTLAESLLFGHIRGAFTGADRTQTGQLEAAGKGTILLDDIDALPTEVQAKLLRVVEAREFYPVGDSKIRPFRARLLSATNCSLDKLVDSKSFRSDLFFRLNAYEIAIPPLRNRTDLIADLAIEFANHFCERNKLPAAKISERLLEQLQSYAWPGNLRELRNAVENAIINCDNRPPAIEDFPPHIVQEVSASASFVDDKSPSPSQNDSLIDEDSGVRSLIAALSKNDFNRSKTARELGVSRMTIYNKMRRLKLS